MSPRRGSKPRLTDRLVVGRNVTLTLVVRPSWALKPGLTDRLVVARKVTLTLTLSTGAELC
jgi:hypothetical protein